MKYFTKSLVSLFAETLVRRTRRQKETVLFSESSAIGHRPQPKAGLFEPGCLLQEIFNTHPFLSFLTVSIAIHFAIFSSIPIKNVSRNHFQQEFFEVDLVPPLPLSPKEIKAPPNITKNSESVTSSRLSKPAKKLNSGKAFRENKSSEFFLRKTEQEATVSLDANDKKHPKYSSYLDHLRYKISSVWQYPALAKKQGIQGELTLRFSIGRNGRLIGVKLLDPSGHSILDQEAMRTIHIATPFSPFPEGFNISKLNVLASFTYQFTKY
jgi:TonB family protein